MAKAKAGERLGLFQQVILVVGIFLLLLSIYPSIKNGRAIPQVLSATTADAQSSRLPSSFPTTIPSSTPSHLQPQSKAQSLYGLPARLEIPKLGINAHVIEMGLTANGNMDAPGNMQDVGWYKYGPRPGEVGSAVIDGHLGVGVRGVFADLHKLEVGDKITVLDKIGQRISFVVRRIEIYDRLARPEEVFVSNDGVHLNLITCSGPWNKKYGTPDRLVVFTDLEN